MCSVHPMLWWAVMTRPIKLKLLRNRQFNRGEIISSYAVKQEIKRRFHSRNGFSGKKSRSDAVPILKIKTGTRYSVPQKTGIGTAVPERKPFLAHACLRHRDWPTDFIFSLNILVLQQLPYSIAFAAAVMQKNYVTLRHQLLHKFSFIVPTFSQICLLLQLSQVLYGVHADCMQ